MWPNCGPFQQFMSRADQDRNCGLLRSHCLRFLKKVVLFGRASFYFKLELLLLKVKSCGQKSKRHQSVKKKTRPQFWVFGTAIGWVVNRVDLLFMAGPKNQNSTVYMHPGCVLLCPYFCKVSFKNYGPPTANLWSTWSPQKIGHFSHCYFLSWAQCHIIFWANKNAKKLGPHKRDLGEKQRFLGSNALKIGGTLQGNAVCPILHRGSFL